MRSSAEKTAIPTPDEMVAALEGCDALRRGHFLLSSGLHSPAYVQCALYLSDPRRAATAGRRWPPSSPGPVSSRSSRRRSAA
ncbi:MAG: hypothetical protein R2862_09370 [Thermoanaerobaculia bacterium]